MLDITKRVHIGAALFTPGLGGISRVARNTARAIIETGADVSLLGLLDSQSVGISGHMSRIAKGSKLSFLASCYAAAATHHSFIYDSLGLARAHPRLPFLSRPYAVWIHGIEVWCSLPTERKQVINRADLVLSNSAYTLARYEQTHGKLPNARVCRLATEEDDLPLETAKFNGPPTVLIVARMDEGDLYKGHVELIGAWPKVVASVPDARLVIVGSGSGKQKVIDLAAASNASPSITITGFLSEEELARVWSEAHVFAMPSRAEGFGLVYIEAMRHGIPVIASVHDAGQEVNIDGCTGYNVDLDMAGSLESRIIEMLRDTDLTQRMGSAAQIRWRENFRYSAFKERLLEVLT